MATSKSDSGRTQVTYEWGDEGAVVVRVIRDGRVAHHFTLNRELNVNKEE